MGGGKSVEWFLVSMIDATWHDFKSSSVHRTSRLAI